MKRFLIVLFIGIGLQAASQNAVGWVKSYSGTVGETPFTMHLHKAANDYDAYVYYMNTEQPYHLSAQMQKSKTITLLGAPPDSDKQEKWVLNIVGKKITGNLSINNKSTVLTAIERNFEAAATYVFTEKKENIFPSAKTSPQASFYQSGIWYTNNSFVNKILWPNIKGTATAGSYFLENRNSFIASVKEEHKELKPADYKEASYMYNRDMLGKLLMTYVSKNLLVFSADSYSFSGGAHGNYGTGHYVIDMRNEKLLALQDIITDTAELSILLEKNFRRMYKVPANQSLVDYGLFTNQISPNENFFLTQKCLGFTFNPYEIGPYAAGQIIIYIPLKEFTPLLTDYAKGLFKDE
jgi:hypothetical protein